MGGLVGGVTIWIYGGRWWGLNAMPLAGIRARHGLVLGATCRRRSLMAMFSAPSSTSSRGGVGVLFAYSWPYFRRAVKPGLPFAMIAWIVMHIAIMVASDNHPNYYDPNVIIGGFMSHFFFAVPMALYVKDRMSSKVR